MTDEKIETERVKNLLQDFDLAYTVEYILM